MPSPPTYDELAQEVQALKRRCASLEASLATGTREAPLHRLIEHVQKGIVVLRDEAFLYVNPYACALLGRSLEALRGASFVEWIHPEDRHRILNRYRRETAGAKVLPEWTFRILDPSGTVHWVRTRSVWVDWEDAPALLVSLMDITALKDAEERLRASEERFRTVLEGLPGGVFAHDLDGRILLVNDAAAHNTGYTREELAALRVGHIDAGSMTREDRNRLWARLAKGETLRIESSHLRKDGSEYPVEVYLSAVELRGKPAVLAVAYDVTEKKRAEEDRRRLEVQLSRAQKMEAIGTLAGGIAHDFNNILAIIIGNIELALLDLPDGSLSREELEQVHEAALRARDLVGRILLFARHKEQTLSDIRFQPIVKESLKMLRASIPATVEIRPHILEDADPVLADPSQMQQIVMNLCANAAQAMEAEGGVLEVSLDQAAFQGPLDTATGRLPQGRYVRLRVRDTGPGIPTAHLERVFEPFFTTKEVGHGTGLGLSVVHGIVQEREGGVTVESQEGRGTEFCVYLPSSNGGVPREVAKQATPLPQGHETILFVDDEPMILETGRRMLERLGYTVETRASGTDALACFRQNPDRFDLVITDMTMPALRGDHLAREILAARPDARIVLCTGFSRQISEDEARRIGIRALVLKPLTAEHLAATVRDVLDTP